MLTKTKKYVNNDKGYSLVFVLILIAVLSITGVSIMGVTANNVKMSSGERNHQATYYIAEAGVNYTVVDVEKHIMNAYEEANGADEFFESLKQNINDSYPIVLDSNTFEETFGIVPEATIMVTEHSIINDTTRQYKITSDGAIDNRARTAEAFFTVEWKESYKTPVPYLNDMAIISQDLLTSGNNTEIHGSVLVGGSYEIGGQLFGTIGPYLGPPINTPEFPSFPSYPAGVTNYTSINPITTSRFFDRVDSSKLIFNIGNQDINIYMNSLRLQNTDLTINSTGTGKVNLYIKNTVSFGGSVNLNVGGDIEKLNIFYAGSDAISITSNNIKIYGSLFLKQANLSQTGGELHGHIISGGSSVTLSGNSASKATLILAPYATVRLNGGARSGAVVAEDIVLWGGSKIYHAKIPSQDLVPFFPEEEFVEVGEEPKMTSQPVKEK